MIDNDDLLHRVDQHYLGPTGLTLPFRIRYAALGLGAALMVIVFVIARGIVHIPLGFKSLVVVIGIVVVLTAKVTKVVNSDRPVRSVVRAAWNDLNAPRPPKAGQTVTLRLPAISSASGRKHAATPNEGESSR